MKCEFEYCIYNKDFECILKETTINPLGMCQECIAVTLDRAFIETEKERQLREIENE